MLFPLVDTEKFTAREDKKRMIVSCGRFFAGGHNKKHLFMIKMFKGLYDDGKLPRWEYHLCGGSHPEKIHQEYLDKVKAATAGYPIFVHEDIDFKSLKNLYADATVFWHAAGFGESEKSHPDKFEHFGITTVEAMSAGCIPLVINRGGQTEIVADGINGFLFDTTDEMMEKMIRIANMKDEARKTLSVRAQMDAARFSRKAFAERMDEILCLMNQTNRDA
jgi:glycosyltransferase involved in cell wall biosynthesis